MPKKPTMRVERPPAEDLHWIVEWVEQFCPADDEAERHARCLAWLRGMVEKCEVESAVDEVIEAMDGGVTRTQARQALMRHWAGQGKKPG